MATGDDEGTDVRRLVFAAFAVLTIVGVVLSVVVVDEASAIPPRIYVFGFLGATVYVFTSLAEKFDEEDQYALETASKGIAAFPLAAGVYLLAFAFPATNGDAASQPADRIISGLVFLSGAYVSLTLRALGGLAKRMLGVSEEEERNDDDDAGGTGGGQPEPTDGDGTDEGGDTGAGAEGGDTDAGDEGGDTDAGDEGGGTDAGDEGGDTGAGDGPDDSGDGSESVESDPEDADDGTR